MNYLYNFLINTQCAVMASDPSKMKNHPIPHETQHPLVDLYRATNVEEYTRARQKINEMAAYFNDWIDSIKETDSDWPEQMQKTREAIKTIALEILNVSLQPPQRNKVYESVYHIGRPLNTTRHDWGEVNAPNDVARLIQALDLNGYIGRSAKYCSIYDEQNRSNWYDLGLGGYLANGGTVSYINGISTTFESALSDACRFSENLANSHHIEGVYNATLNLEQDTSLIIAVQGGLLTTPAKLLLNQWTSFFNRAPEGKKYLQICFSQGAAHVRNALQVLPPKLQNRICVIAIAPSVTIPENEGCQVMHFYKKEDPFFSMTLGRCGSLDRPNIIRIEPDAADHHDPHGPNFVKTVRKYVQNYLNTNNIRD